jgi:predicted ATPase/Tfp pilus assembly protein PilF
MTGRVIEILIQVVGGVIASLILIVAGALVARWYSPRRRELVRIYARSARQVFGLPRAKLRDLFRDQDVQLQLLNPSVGLEQEWAVLCDELAQRGVGAETLASAEPFYRVLLTQLELSDHWRDRGRTLAEQLRAAHPLADQPARLDRAPPSAAGRSAAAAPRAGNLPAAATPFVGRQEEIAAWCELLRQPTTRLLSLVASGGLGKTRAALEIARGCGEDFADGVWWVELEEARSREEMVQRVAAALSLETDSQGAPHEQLLRFLRERHALLVLDNVEQVAGAAELVAEILEAAPGVRCLATSRRALDLHAERRVDVRPLPLSEARQLFDERARARGADFSGGAAGDRDAEVMELCRRLEGVPLALELAASRIGDLTPREMLERLNERFRLLQSHAPDLPERQRTLQGAIDWSYDLLSEEEQAVFARLSVFRGGFFMAAAEAVCGAGAPEAARKLREVSLLQSREALGRTRYAMSESIRDYAAGKLGDEASARTAHARCFLEVAERETARPPDGEAEALQLLALEMDNLRAAWQWATGQEHDELAARLALAMAVSLRQQGWWQERFAWLQEGLAAGERCGSLAPGQVARLRYELGFAFLERGEFGAAGPLLEASLETHRELGDPGGEADCLNRLGNLAYLQGRSDAARAYYEDALILRRMAGDAAGEASLMNNLAGLAQQEGNLAEARERLKEGLQIDRQLDHLPGIAMALNNLGYLSLRLGDLDEAQRLLEESRDLKTRLGDHWGLAHTLHNLGDVARARGDSASARQHYREALRIRSELDAKHEIAESLLGVGELLADEQKWTEAALLLTVAEATFAEAHSPDLEPAQSALRRIADDIGAEQLAQLRRVAQRFTLAQATERALGL